MKKIKKLEKILLILAVFAGLCGITTISRATVDVSEILNIPDFTSSAVEQPPVSSAPVENPPANDIGNVQNTNKTLPKTGVNDTATWALVAVCVGLAIYTYKKVRDYNV